MKQTSKQVSNREHKSSAFTTFFSNPENAAKLYSALEGIEVSPDEIKFATLQGVLFLARKNDLAFTVKNKILVISEHQATLNKNMPLRDVIYYGRTAEKLVESESLYRNSLIKIPTPEFYVFYNGTDDYPEEKILKLSDAYIENTGDPMLELKVKVINVNLPVNHPLLEDCRPMYEYSWFIQHIRDYTAEGMGLDEAITQAFRDCEREGIMVEFLKEHGSEVVNMLFTEFNMDDALRVRGEERFEEGLQEGLEKGLEKGLKEGKQDGLVQGIIETCMEFKLSREDTLTRIKDKFHLSENKAEEYLAKYWTA